jgi:putative hydrolase of the HAD superfamily
MELAKRYRLDVLRALLTDLDGVVRVWPPDHAAGIERDHGLPAGTIAATAFAADLLEQALTGAISDKTWRDRIGQAIAERHGSDAALAVEAWSSFRGLVDLEVLSLLREVRGVMPVILLTNQTTRLAGDLEALAIADAFDAVASSAELGVVKPARAAFEAAWRLARVSPSECIFIDDRASNVEAARDLGMTAILHHNAADTRRALIACGLPLT